MIGGTIALKSAYVLVFLAGETMSLGVRLVSFARHWSLFLCFLFYILYLLQENQVTIALPRADEKYNFYGRRKEDGLMRDPVDDEYCWRPRRVLLINRLKANVSVSIFLL